MRNLQDILNERKLKEKEYNNKLLKEKRIKEQWQVIENNIDKTEIKHNTKRIPLCKNPLYEENKNRLINEYGFEDRHLKHYLENWYIELLDDINLNTQEKTLKECIDKAKETWSNKTIDEKVKEYNEYQNKIKNVQESQREELKDITNELNKNYLNNQQEDKLNKNSRNNIKTIINSLNNESDSKYNLNDGQHNNRKDIFGKRINKENKINIDSVDKASEKSDKTTIQMYKYEDGEFKKINSDEIDSDIKQQSKEDKLETFADLINHVLGFKYC